jgi:hypothetical protein
MTRISTGPLADSSFRPSCRSRAENRVTPGSHHSRGAAGAPGLPMLKPWREENSTRVSSFWVSPVLSITVLRFRVRTGLREVAMVKPTPPTSRPEACPLTQPLPHLGKPRSGRIGRRGVRGMHAALRTRRRQPDAALSHGQFINSHWLWCRWRQRLRTPSESRVIRRMAPPNGPAYHLCSDRRRSGQGRKRYGAREQGLLSAE